MSLCRGRTSKSTSSALTTLTRKRASRLSLTASCSAIKRCVATSLLLASVSSQSATFFQIPVCFFSMHLASVLHCCPYRTVFYLLLQGKEVRFPILLTSKEKDIARRVCLAFKQNVCGFDLLRAPGRSYVCDVNGWSFVKKSHKYYDDAAHLLQLMMLRAITPERLHASILQHLSPPAGLTSHFRAFGDRFGRDRDGSGAAAAGGAGAGSGASGSAAATRTASPLVPGGAAGVSRTPSLLDDMTGGSHAGGAGGFARNYTSSSLSGMDSLDAALSGRGGTLSGALVGAGSSGSGAGGAGSGGAGAEEELRCVVAVIRHGDRTPKQKMKMTVTHADFLALHKRFAKGAHDEAKLKSAQQLQAVLEVTRALISSRLASSAVARSSLAVAVAEGGVGAAAGVAPPAVVNDADAEPSPAPLSSLHGQGLGLGGAGGSVSSFGGLGGMGGPTWTSAASVAASTVAPPDADGPDYEEDIDKLLQMKVVLEKGGHFSGINRKVQLKPTKWRRISRAEAAAAAAAASAASASVGGVAGGPGGDLSTSIALPIPLSPGMDPSVIVAGGSGLGAPPLPLPLVTGLTVGVPPHDASSVSGSYLSLSALAGGGVSPSDATPLPTAPMRHAPGHSHSHSSHGHTHAHGHGTLHSASGSGMGMAPASAPLSPPRPAARSSSNGGGSNHCSPVRKPSKAETLLAAELLAAGAADAASVAAASTAPAASAGTDAEAAAAMPADACALNTTIGSVDVGGSSSDCESGDGDGDCIYEVTECLLVLKWGGVLTHAGRGQAEALGQRFRSVMYPGESVGLLRLHSTYRHDLKVYSSDEGRVQMTAAAFVKGFLDLEGELTPILASLVKTVNTETLLDDSDPARDVMSLVKARIKRTLLKTWPAPAGADDAAAAAEAAAAASAASTLASAAALAANSSLSSSGAGVSAMLTLSPSPSPTAAEGAARLASARASLVSLAGGGASALALSNSSSGSGSGHADSESAAAAASMAALSTAGGRSSGGGVRPGLPGGPPGLLTASPQPLDGFVFAPPASLPSTRASSSLQLTLLAPLGSVGSVGGGLNTGGMQGLGSVLSGSELASPSPSAVSPTLGPAVAPAASAPDAAAVAVLPSDAEVAALCASINPQLIEEIAPLRGAALLRALRIIGPDPPAALRRLHTVITGLVEQLSGMLRAKHGRAELRQRAIAEGSGSAAGGAVSSVSATPAADGSVAGNAALSAAVCTDSACPAHGRTSAGTVGPADSASSAAANAASAADSQAQGQAGPPLLCSTAAAAAAAAGIAAPKPRHRHHDSEIERMVRSQFEEELPPLTNGDGNGNGNGDGNNSPASASQAAGGSTADGSNPNGAHAASSALADEAAGLGGSSVGLVLEGGSDSVSVAGSTAGTVAAGSASAPGSGLVVTARSISGVSIAPSSPGSMVSSGLSPAASSASGAAAAFMSRALSDASAAGSAAGTAVRGAAASAGPGMAPLSLDAHSSAGGDGDSAQRIATGGGRADADGRNRRVGVSGAAGGSGGSSESASAVHVARRERFYSGELCCSGETLWLMCERWKKLAKDFFHPRKGRFDLSKIPDILDQVKYDCLHNAVLGLRDLPELHRLAEAFADIVVSQEYGITAGEKRDIGARICHHLLRKIFFDMTAVAVEDAMCDAAASQAAAAAAAAGAGVSGGGGGLSASGVGMSIGGAPSTLLREKYRRATSAASVFASVSGSSSGSMGDTATARELVGTTAAPAEPTTVTATSSAPAAVTGSDSCGSGASGMPRSGSGGAGAAFSAAAPTAGAATTPAETIAAAADATALMGAAASVTGAAGSAPAATSASTTASASASRSQSRRPGSVKFAEPVLVSGTATGASTQTPSAPASAGALAATDASVARPQSPPAGVPVSPAASDPAATTSAATATTAPLASGASASGEPASAYGIANLTTGVGDYATAIKPTLSTDAQTAAAAAITDDKSASAAPSTPSAAAASRSAVGAPLWFPGGGAAGAMPAAGASLPLSIFDGSSPLTGLVVTLRQHGASAAGAEGRARRRRKSCPPVLHIGMAGSPRIAVWEHEETGRHPLAQQAVGPTFLPGYGFLVPGVAAGALTAPGGAYWQVRHAPHLPYGYTGPYASASGAGAGTGSGSGVAGGAGAAGARPPLMPRAATTGTSGGGGLLSSMQRSQSSLPLSSAAGSGLGSGSGASLSGSSGGGSNGGSGSGTSGSSSSGAIALVPFSTSAPRVASARSGSGSARDGSGSGSSSGLPGSGSGGAGGASAGSSEVAGGAGGPGPSGSPSGIPAPMDDDLDRRSESGGGRNDGASAAYERLTGPVLVPGFRLRQRAAAAAAAGAGAADAASAAAQAPSSVALKSSPSNSSEGSGGVAGGGALGIPFSLSGGETAAATSAAAAAAGAGGAGGAHGSIDDGAAAQQEDASGALSSRSASTAAGGAAASVAYAGRGQVGGLPASSSCRSLESLASAASTRDGDRDRDRDRGITPGAASAGDASGGRESVSTAGGGNRRDRAASGYTDGTPLPGASGSSLRASPLPVSPSESISAAAGAGAAGTDLLGLPLSLADAAASGAADALEASVPATPHPATGKAGPVVPTPASATAAQAASAAAASAAAAATAAADKMSAIMAVLAEDLHDVSETVHQLDARVIEASSGDAGGYGGSGEAGGYGEIKTPTRHVRTRLYFTSESHVHALINTLKYWRRSGSDAPGASAAASAAAAAAASAPPSVDAGSAAAVGSPASISDAASIDVADGQTEPAAAALSAVPSGAAAAGSSGGSSGGSSSTGALVSSDGLRLLDATPELDYCTHIVFRLYENFQFPLGHPKRHRLEILFSPGASFSPFDGAPRPPRRVVTTAAAAAAAAGVGSTSAAGAAAAAGDGAAACIVELPPSVQAWAAAGTDVAPISLCADFSPAAGALAAATGAQAAPAPASASAGLPAAGLPPRPPLASTPSPCVSCPSAVSVAASTSALASAAAGSLASASGGGGGGGYSPAGRRGRASSSFDSKQGRDSGLDGSGSGSSSVSFGGRGLFAGIAAGSPCAASAGLTVYSGPAVASQEGLNEHTLPVAGVAPISACELLTAPPHAAVAVAAGLSDSASSASLAGAGVQLVPVPQLSVSQSVTLDEFEDILAEAIYHGTTLQEGDGEGGPGEQHPKEEARARAAQIQARRARAMANGYFLQ